MSLEDWRGHKPQMISYYVKAVGPMKLFAGDHLNRHFMDRAGLEKAIADLGRSEYIEITDQDLSGFDFSKMNLQKLRFKGCKLCHADFDEANVEGTRVDGSDLLGALISRAQLRLMKGIPAVPPYSTLVAGRIHKIRRKGPGL